MNSWEQSSQQILEWVQNLEGRSLRRSVAQKAAESLIDFSSNDYLGFGSTNALQLITRCTNSVSLGSGGSRLVFSHSDSVTEIETKWARVFGFDKAFLVGSAFVANCILLEAFAWVQKVGVGWKVHCDLYSHASIHQGIKAQSTKVDFFRSTQLDRLKPKLLKNTSGVQILFLEGLHSMWGSQIHRKTLEDLAEIENLYFAFDESHSFGVLGEKGTGCFDQSQKIREKTVAVILGGGKALGVQGGLILLKSPLPEAVLQGSYFFRYTTGVSPLFAFAFDFQLNRCMSEEGGEARKKLKVNICSLHSRLEREGIPLGNPQTSGLESMNSPIVSILIPGDQNVLAAEGFFKKQGLLVKAMRSPTVPRGQEQLRVVVRASHHEKEIDRLCLSMSQLLKPMHSGS
jgi:8-amino-7-oxononanoate synthase